MAFCVLAITISPLVFLSMPFGVIGVKSRLDAIEAILEAPDELAAELATLAVPVLVITGSQDTLTPLGDAEELAELIPGASLVLLSGAAHGLMAEAPNGFNDAVVRFLTEVDEAERAITERAESA